MKRQQFPDRPTMIGDPGGHRWRLLAPCHVQTLVRRAEVVDRADQVHPMLQRQRTAGECPASPCQRGQALTKRGVEPLDVRRVDHPVPL